MYKKLHNVFYPILLFMYNTQLQRTATYNMSAMMNRRDEIVWGTKKGKKVQYIMATL